MFFYLTFIFFKVKIVFQGGYATVSLASLKTAKGKMVAPLILKITDTWLLLTGQPQRKKP